MNIDDIYSVFDVEKRNPVGPELFIGQNYQYQLLRKYTVHTVKKTTGTLHHHQVRTTSTLRPAQNIKTQNERGTVSK